MWGWHSQQVIIIIIIYNHDEDDDNHDDDDDEDADEDDDDDDHDVCSRFHRGAILFNWTGLDGMDGYLYGVKLSIIRW